MLAKWGGATQRLAQKPATKTVTASGSQTRVKTALPNMILAYMVPCLPDYVKPERARRSIADRFSLRGLTCQFGLSKTRVNTSTSNQFTSFTTLLTWRRFEKVR